MASPEHPQIYLITPTSFDTGPFCDTLARVLDATEIACVRLDIASSDETEVAHAADTLREVTHARDVALVIVDHVLMVPRLGLDGVHLSDAARSVRSARRDLGLDAIVGSFCAGSRHDGISAGEAGADYISFGPVTTTGLGDGSLAGGELFQWWSEMIELPVVAEGGLTAQAVRDLAPHTDFFGIGDDIWRQPDPVAALLALQGAMT